MITQIVQFRDIHTRKLIKELNIPGVILHLDTDIISQNKKYKIVASDFNLDTQTCIIWLKKK